MTFREIDDALTALVDPETGEILDVSAFEALQMERDKKAENMALWVLDLKDELVSISAEIDRLKGRRSAIERKIDSLKNYLPVITAGQKIKTPLVTVSYRPSRSVELFDENAVIEWAQKTDNDGTVLKYQQPEVSKTAVKKILESGKPVPGAILVDKMSTIVK